VGCDPASVFQALKDDNQAGEGVVSVSFDPAVGIFGAPARISGPAARQVCCESHGPQKIGAGEPIHVLTRLGLGYYQ
jgi:hypothetical protein